MEPSNAFLVQAKAESLDPSDKLQMRVRLRAFMDQNPATDAIRAGRLRWPMLWVRLTAVTTGLCLVAAGGGAAYAAEDAEPGESLYVLKRYINEPVMVALAFDAEAKASAHNKILQRRLREIESFVLRGEETLTAVWDENIRTNLTYHLEATQSSIAQLALERPDAATAENARIEAELEAHATVLSALQLSSAPDIRPFLEEVTSAVSSAAKAASSTRASFESADAKASRISAEARLEQSERGLAEAQRALDRMHGIADERSLLRAKKKLAEAEAELSEGKETLKAESFVEALEKGRLARRKAEESRVMAINGTIKGSAGGSTSASQEHSAGSSAVSTGGSASAGILAPGRK